MEGMGGREVCALRHCERVPHLAVRALATCCCAVLCCALVRRIVHCSSALNALCNNLQIVQSLARAQPLRCLLLCRETRQMFKYITQQGNWGWATREAAYWSGAALMWRIGKGMPKKYGLGPDLRADLYAQARANA